MSRSSRRGVRRRPATDANSSVTGAGTRRLPGPTPRARDTAPVAAPRTGAGDVPVGRSAGAAEDRGEGRPWPDSTRRRRGGRERSPLAGASRESYSGGDLLSQGVAPQVPSALAGLTSVFGMGTGVTPPLWPPETC